MDSPTSPSTPSASRRSRKYMYWQSSWLHCSRKSRSQGHRRGNSLLRRCEAWPVVHRCSASARSGQPPPRCCCFFNEVVPVVCVHGSAAQRRLVNSPSKRVVFEADRSTASWQQDASQAVLEVPGVACGVRSHHFCQRVSVVVERVGTSSVRSQ